jgi:calcineurin-like phosphoesterase family protein
MNGMILSHIPIHEESLGRFGTNIHGHLHSNRVMKDGTVDVRYHCVCVEQTDFAPILFEDVIKRITAEGGTIGFKNGNHGVD